MEKYFTVIRDFSPIVLRVQYTVDKLEAGPRLRLPERRSSPHKSLLLGQRCRLELM